MKGVKGTCKVLFYTPFGFAYTAGHIKYSKAIGLTGRGRGPSVTVKYFHVIHSGHIHICANGFKQTSAVLAEQIIFLKSWVV